MGLGNCLTIIEKQTQFDTPSFQSHEIVATVNNQKVKFAISRKDES